MELLLIKQCSRSSQGSMSEPVGLIARQTSSNRAISHGLGHQSHVSRARGSQRQKRIKPGLRKLKNFAHWIEGLLHPLTLLRRDTFCKCQSTQPFTHQTRSIGNRTHARTSWELALKTLQSDTRQHRDQQRRLA